MAKWPLGQKQLKQEEKGFTDVSSDSGDEVTQTIPVPVLLQRALCSGLKLSLLNHSGPWSSGRDGLKQSTPELWEAHRP